MELKDFSVRTSGEYPEIEDASPNRVNVAILRDLAFCKIGELSGILRYIFQSSILLKKQEELSKLFEEISIVEMTHMFMLMQAITDFGGTPTYFDAMQKAFSSSFVSYSTDLKQMLITNIADEKQAIKDYVEASEYVENKSLKDLFVRISEDEKCHLKIFEYIMQNLEKYV